MFQHSPLWVVRRRTCGPIASAFSAYILGILYDISHLQQPFSLFFTFFAMSFIPFFHFFLRSLFFPVHMIFFRHSFLSNGVSWLSLALIPWSVKHEPFNLKWLV